MRCIRPSAKPRSSRCAPTPGRPFPTICRGSLPAADERTSMDYTVTASCSRRPSPSAPPRPCSRPRQAMKIIVNGVERELAAATLAAALKALEYEDAIVATALNGHFVPARKREETKLAEGDRVEIVAPRQGG